MLNGGDQLGQHVGYNRVPGQLGEWKERGTSQAGRDAGIIAVGDFRLDLRSHRALVKGCEIQLDSAEFEMLMFLISHHTNVVTPQTRLTAQSGRVIEQPDFLRLLASLQRKLESVPGGARYLAH